MCIPLDCFRLFLLKWRFSCCFKLNNSSCIVYFQGINPLIAKKMQEDRGREYMNARRVAKEYEAVTKGLNKNAPSVPPTNTPDEAKQVHIVKSCDFYYVVCRLCYECDYWMVVYSIQGGQRKQKALHLHVTMASLVFCG